MELSVLQTLVRRWCVRAFGEVVANDRRERNHRFLEEVLELVQALGCTREDAHVLVEYVYGRPAGKPGQEVGGVLVTLAALCAAHDDLSMNEAAKAELSRVNRPEVLDRIRAKHAAKQQDMPLSPLPGQAAQDVVVEDRRRTHTMECASKNFRPGKGWDACDCGAARQHTDAVATSGGKATVSHLQNCGTNAAPRTKKPDFTPPGQGQP